MKIKAGIFFGGPSREREISFAGGRTVYDNLNKSVFEPIPIFVDSHRDFILLEWPYLYKGTIRDFYPPVAALPPSPHHFQVYLESLGELSAAEKENLIRQVGRRVAPSELPDLIDLAFLALHGLYGEDGHIQQELADLGIPYTGSGVRASQIGMDKALQKDLMGERGFDRPNIMVLSRAEWIDHPVSAFFDAAADRIGFPMVIRPANQGSSIGVAIIDEHSTAVDFEEAVNRAFFRELIPVGSWLADSEYDRIDHVRLLTDIRDGLGFPMDVRLNDEHATLHHPEELLAWLNEKAGAAAASDVFVLESHLDEQKVILEEFIHGKEFSCIVIRKEDGSAVALPPTEIVKGKEVFDYRSKYLPGLSRKETPIKLPPAQTDAIRRECERLFTELGFQTYARIDGFITAEERLFLNDPNTTSGMLPSSFFFHQAAEIGLNPSQFLTFVIRASLQERLAEQPGDQALAALLDRLDRAVASLKTEAPDKKRIAVIMGGYSFERHISVESGRNVFEKLASSDKYDPIPVFLLGDDKSYALYRLPVNLLLKDNADDIRDRILNWSPHEVVEAIKEQCADITAKYATTDTVFSPQQLSLAALSSLVDGVFIALHGRPGEDGQLQAALDAVGLPYNGSNRQSSEITIDKYRTLRTLRRNGFPVTEQLLMKKEQFAADPEDFTAKVESYLTYPLVAKPVDDGCSSAVIVINNREQLLAYTRLLFRPQGERGDEARRLLKLRPREEFPRKEAVLFEAMVKPEGAAHFLEITGGLLTHRRADGGLEYEIFEPSETLASGEVLSLEEKFLAGEGQNITPARFGNGPRTYQEVAPYVKEDLERAARILNVQGYARIDAFVRIFPDRRPETIIIEVNSLPGMTPATAIFHQAALNGYKPFEFIDRILTFAMPKKEKKAPAAATVLAVEPGLDAVAETVNYAGPPGRPPQYQDQNAAVAEKPVAETFRERAQDILKKIWNFLRSPIFLVNFAGMLGLILGLLLLITWGLSLYTHHGESLQVHNYVGLQVEEAIKKARSRSFSVVISDSIFILDERPNKVLEQDPKAFSRVKKNRRIYLVISKSQPDLVNLPNLIGSYKYEQYTRKLKRLGLRFRVKERVYNSREEENMIKHFYYQGRKITQDDLQKGMKVPMGAMLEFVITEKQTDMVVLPDLVCKDYEAGVFLINSMNLAVGNVYGDVDDRENAYIWKQEPAYDIGRMVRMGRQVDIYLTSTRPESCPPETAPDDAPQEEDPF